MIAITFALPAESSELARLIRDNKLSDREVSIWHTGVGRKTAERKIDNFLRAEKPAFLISAGFAGAVRDDFQTGDIILAENFSDRGLLSLVQAALENRARVAPLFTAATVVDSIDQRNQIAQAHDAAAVDMETEVIARACAAYGIPMLSLRAISDSPRELFPAPANVLFDLERQATNSKALLLYLLKNPTSIWRLIHFAKRIGRVRKSLTAALIVAVESFPA